VLSIPGAIAGRTSTKLIANRAINKYSLIAGDLVAFLLAGVLANVLHWLYLGAPASEFLRIWTGSSGEIRVSLFAGLVAVSIGWLWALGHYTRRRPFWDEIAEILRVLAVVAVLDAALLYLAKLQFSRFWFIGIWVLALALIPFARLMVKRVLVGLGYWKRSAVVLGTGPDALEAVEALHSEPAMGFETVAFLLPPNAEGVHPSHLHVQGKLLPVISPLDNPRGTLESLGKPTIIVALAQDDLTREAKLITRLHRYCDDLRVVPPVRGLPLFGATVHHFFRHELFFLSLRNNLARRAPRLLKRIFDLGVSTFLLVALSPLFAYFAWQIRKDGGPVFFLHDRVGRDGHPFRCAKFRTMVPNAAVVLEDFLKSDPEARAEWEKDFKLKSDPRVTKIGKFLREYSLDELPQLWNVLRGEMSLVGPRPIVEDELQRYAESADFYLETNPGMTGLWQVSGRNNTEYSYRVYLDSWYVKNWSLWYDIVILIKTVRVVVAREGAF
jgi:undecaprenyl-phosphate galactose phosphotransferase